MNPIVLQKYGAFGNRQKQLQLHFKTLTEATSISIVSCKLKKQSRSRQNNSSVKFFSSSLVNTYYGIGSAALSNIYKSDFVISGVVINQPFSFWRAFTFFMYILKVTSQLLKYSVCKGALFLFFLCTYQAYLLLYFFFG